MDLEPKDIEAIRLAVEATLTSDLLQGARERYQARGLSSRRFRWDVFRLALGQDSVLLARVYRYVTDVEIDAVLQRIVG